MTSSQAEQPDFTPPAKAPSSAVDAPSVVSGKGGQLIVLAGPTAVGKGTVAGYIIRNYSQIRLSISATTRAPRPGEVDGQHYFFVSEDRFTEMIAQDEFLEWATVHNRHRYGTPKQPVLDSLARGENVLLEIDVQGAFQVQQNFPEAVLVFLHPPSWEELVRRLRGRGTETAEEQALRLETARTELATADRFSHHIINDEVAKAAASIVDLIG